MTSLTAHFGNVIDTYTRAQAIEDGVLIDVTDVAKKAGIKYPVALTNAVWFTYIVPDDRSRVQGQSENGRLWDALWMFSMAARRTEGAIMYYKLHFITKEKLKRLVTLKAMVLPGDNMEPVITIMLPDED